ncbi:MAG: Y-family DNA polymerase [Verrucomicrobiales bacterium]
MLLHLDADAFFASVEQAACARLRGRPVAVGGARRGIIASASYEARKLGIYTPMPTSLALKICPKLILLPGDFEKYEMFSRLMFSYFHDFTPLVEITGIDEGYCDLGGLRKWRPEDAARRISEAIGQSLRLPVSEGVATNKLVSQIASKLRKPQGFIHVPAGEEAGFLAPLEVERLPGIGPKMKELFHRAGLRQIGQLATLPPEHLRSVAGNGARELAEFARGVDRRPLRPDEEPARSFGAQESFEQDTCDHGVVRDALRCLIDGLVQRMRGESASARVVALKLRYTDLQEIERSESLAEPSCLAEDFYTSLDRLLEKAWDRRVRLRMVRVKLSGIYHHWPAHTLLYTLEGKDKHERLQAVIADVQGRYGSKSLMRGHQWRRDLARRAGETPPSSPATATKSARNGFRSA